MAVEFMEQFDIESSVGFLMYKAHQRLSAELRTLLEPSGLTQQQFVLLAFLWSDDGQSQRVLSEKTAVDRTTISGLVDRLQKQGLVRRMPDPEDRRAWQIFLTPAGRALKNDVAPLISKLREQVLGDFAPGEYQQLCRLLMKLRQGGQ